METLREKSNEYSGFGICGYLLIFISYLVTFITFPISIFLALKIVKEYERAVILRLGRILQGGAKGPGLFFILPCIDNCVYVDLRTVTFNVPPQEILTKDSVTITVDAVCYYRTFNPVAAVTNVENASYSTRLLAATSLRNILGTRTLQEILQEKDNIQYNVYETIDAVSEKWFDSCQNYLKPQIMATEAEATREARAKVIDAEGEQKASLALKQAADTISKSPVALQLRYLQTLTNIGSERNNTIIFPYPAELTEKFFK